jgi:predicted TIM-barrel fold metal-dependent hydrolase
MRGRDASFSGHFFRKTAMADFVHAMWFTIVMLSLGEYVFGSDLPLNKVTLSTLHSVNFTDNEVR